MERRFFRSTSIEHLQAELHQHELLMEARTGSQGRRAGRVERPLTRRRGLPRGLRLLVRRLAG
jgi:hypothetical protein